ncbi:MAG: hypothetical protein JNK14_08750, partial [Chitinophagaceae bacterium]|nr:hypothetical protein [Chitinophagaceae bacterium]
MKFNGKLALFTVILVVITTACKFFFGPELAWSGFSPVIAIALFSGFIIKQKDMSFLLPLLALLISDVAIQVLYTMGEFPYPGFYGGQWKNYLILMVSTLIGWILKGRSYTSLAVGAVAAPTVFFLLSNFGVWMGTAEVVYAKTFSGLMTCYTAGLPFYKNALIATLVFLPVILLSYNALTRNK